ncbi:hypothetical protein KEM60_01194 [Austwickia sp. TVS 96-490-7B]|uniref:gluconokinase n=1 Tax=Austwickia sp. TVS 96-490-7B TaxID=2830843 RepID=UPI001C591AF5|nr:gluconokinase [Austwickia sp. TVS 96-490-7B]MBW3085003.1 hypothetical protein [Austwickia sp. TVS 96-490-7B]
MGNAAPLVVVMGVCGSGKSTLAEALAPALAIHTADADTFHPQANVDKMSAGTPLTDADRLPWLDAIGQWLADHRESGAVVSCSALKSTYRDRLRTIAPDVFFVHLAGPIDVVTERVAERSDHFMPSSLVASQYDILEPLTPAEHGLTLDFTLPVPQLVEQVSAALSSTSRETR